MFTCIVFKIKNNSKYWIKFELLSCLSNDVWRMTVQGRRKVWKSGGGHVILGGDNVPPLVEIGLTDLPKSGGGTLCHYDRPEIISAWSAGQKTIGINQENNGQIFHLKLVKVEPCLNEANIATAKIEFCLDQWDFSWGFLAKIPSTPLYISHWRMSWVSREGNLKEL